MDLHGLPVLRARPGRAGAQRVPLRVLAYHCEYSRNLIFASDAVMETAFDTIVDRTRTRLDVSRPEPTCNRDRQS